MEFKMFPGEDVPESLRDDLAAFSGLSDSDSDWIATWLRGFGQGEDEDERYREIVRYSGLSPDDFDRISGAVRFVHEAWYRQRLQLADVLADLTLLGVESKQVETV